MTTRAPRRPDRRRRPLRHRRRLPPAGPPARQAPTRSSRPATRSAAPGTCSATPASARTRTCTRSATPSARGPRRRRSPTGRRSCSYVRDTAARVRHRPRTSASATGSSRRRLVDAPTRAGPSRPSAPTPASGCTITCGFLFLCAGYYRYDEGYTPEFAGPRALRGHVVHPQHWPEDLDYAGKRVVVIGSGATAVTLVPAMAERGRARDDAPALADLRRLAARRRTRSPNGLRRVLPGADRLRDRPLEERRCCRRRATSSAAARPA